MAEESPPNIITSSAHIRAPVRWAPKTKPARTHKQIQVCRRAAGLVFGIGVRAKGRSKGKPAGALVWKNCPNTKPAAQVGRSVTQGQSKN